MCQFMSLRAATHLSTNNIPVMFLKASGMVLAVVDMRHACSSV